MILASPNTVDDLGKHVFGLQPDDRMPHDWLRMVARVFAAYREKPLEESIAAYIDGLNLSLEWTRDPMARVKITPGQAFVDDQFIGFIEDSFIEFNFRYLDQNKKRYYWICLIYEWIDMAPPRAARIAIVPEDSINYEQMLPLGYVNRISDTEIEVIDEKHPWYVDMFLKMVGDTEVDPVDGDSPSLPYLVAINRYDGIQGDNGVDHDNDTREGTMDIGWAIDFHTILGNLIDYNVRLHTVGGDNDNLYINNKKIITLNYGPPGLSCFDLISEGPNGELRASRTCSDYNNNSASWSNIGDLNNVDNSIINTMTLTNQENLVTINGFPILISRNVQGSSIYFHGFYSDPPTERQERDTDGTIHHYPLQDGDIYYDTDVHAYAFWKNGQWVEFGESSIKSYEIVASSDIPVSQGIPVKHSTSKPAFVWVGGILLSDADYDASSSPDRIYFDRVIQRGETIKILSFINEQNLSTMPAASARETMRTSTTTPVGTIIDFAGIEPPEGYLLCDGSEYSVEEYPELYEVIGTTYGGDDKTFNVPNLPGTIKKLIKY